MKRLITPTAVLLALLASGTSFSQVAGSEMQDVITEVDQVELDLQDMSSIEQINTTTGGESYPWLSADGLRMYFAKGSTDVNIHFAERSTVDEPFTSATTIKLTDKEAFSAWLTNDETEIFFTVYETSEQSSITLYHAERSDRTVEFEEAEKVNLSGDFSGFFSGPSLTQDLEEMYLYNDGELGKSIMVFEKTGDLDYQLIDNLEMTDGMSMAPGQLSKNGLKYYLSVNTENGYDGIYYFEREEIEKPFSSLTKLMDFDTESDYQMLQPTFNQDETRMAFVRNTEDEWDENDIYIAARYLPETPSDEPMTAAFIEISDPYPNPNKGTARFDYRLPEEITSATIRIFTMDGKLISTQTANGSTGTVVMTTDELVNGYYFYQVIAGDITTPMKKMIVMR